MVTIGLGIAPDSSRRRIPRPPQNSTTFIALEHPSRFRRCATVPVLERTPLSDRFALASRADDREAREGDQPAASVLLDPRHRRADLVGKVPREDQHVTGAVAP